jgi:CheY-like chemotaxis protein
MKKYSIVIVENDEDEQLFMKESFDAVPDMFRIIAQLRNGDHLIEWLDQHPDQLPDVILSDLNMPGKNGYDIIDSIRESPIWKHIPVIITSTSATRSIIEKCLQKGAADYLIKPETFIDYDPYVKKLYENIEQKNLVH